MVDGADTSTKGEKRQEKEKSATDKENAFVAALEKAFHACAEREKLKNASQAQADNQSQPSTSAQPGPSTAGLEEDSPHGQGPEDDVYGEFGAFFKEDQYYSEEERDDTTWDDDLAKEQAALDEDKRKHFLAKTLEDDRQFFRVAQSQESQRKHHMSQVLRRQDVALKVGPKWDRAKEIMQTPSNGTVQDREVLELLQKYNAANPVNSLYARALRTGIDHMTVFYKHVEQEREINIYFFKEGSYSVSLDFLKRRTLTELWTFLSKVKRNSEMNEILRDYLREYAAQASPEVCLDPYEVKYLKNGILQTLAFERIEGYPDKQLVWIENMLRSTGGSDKAKWDAADQIQLHCLEKFAAKYQLLKNQLKAPQVQPNMPPRVISESDDLLDRDIVYQIEDDED